jgi:two-component system, sensor histidine kinase and response regulator
LTKDGDALWTEAYCRAVRDDSGNPIGLRGISLDISDRKNAETAMIRAHELALQSLQAKAEFLDNMNHELRTPMNGILGFTQLLLDTDLSEEQRELLEEVTQSADNLLSRVNDILELSSLGAGRIELNSAPFSLPQGLGTIAEEFEETARRKGLYFSWTISSDIPDALEGDFSRLRQLLTTLIDNAIKFTHRGRVTVGVGRDPDTEQSAREAYLRFEVSDTGIGIPSDKRRMIFNAFSQVDGSSTRKYGGMGLGLALCQRLAEILGGRIWVESEENLGSTFYFTLPFKLPICSHGCRTGRDEEKTPALSSEMIHE